MSTTPSPLYPADPNAPQPIQPRSGFLGILKNSVLPAISQAGNALGTLYGSPAVRQGTQALSAENVQEQELARQRAYDVPGLQEAYGRAQTVPYEVQAAAANAEEARKRANMAPADFDQLLDQTRKLGAAQSTAGLAGMLDLADKYNKQSSQPTPPPAGSPVADASGELGTPAPPTSSSSTPSPIADASAPRSMFPAPDEILGAAFGRMMGTPVTDKEQTQNGDGSWSFKRRNPYTSTVVGEEPAAGPPTRFMPSKLLMPYYQAAGIDPGKATPQQTADVLNAYNTNESSKSGIRFEKDVNGNVVQVPYTSGSSVRTHSVVPTNESQTTPGTASAPTKPVRTPKPSASAGNATPVKGPDNQPIQTGKVPKGVSASFDTYNASQERYNVMQDSLAKAIAGIQSGHRDQQAELNLLANHIGMTMGLQKGARINQAIYSEAQRSAPWLAQVATKWDSDGYLSGVTLTRDQMKQMVDLASVRLEQDRQAWQRETQAAKSGFGMNAPSSSPASTTPAGNRPPGW